MDATSAPASSPSALLHVRATVLETLVVVAVEVNVAWLDADEVAVSKVVVMVTLGGTMAICVVVQLQVLPVARLTNPVVVWLEVAVML